MTCACNFIVDVLGRFLMFFMLSICDKETYRNPGTMFKGPRPATNIL